MADAQLRHNSTFHTIVEYSIFPLEIKNEYEYYCQSANQRCCQMRWTSLEAKLISSIIIIETFSIK